MGLGTGSLDALAEAGPACNAAQKQTPRETGSRGVDL